jgi:hypothetical protein
MEDPLHTFKRQHNASRVPHGWHPWGVQMEGVKLQSASSQHSWQLPLQFLVPMAQHLLTLQAVPEVQAAPLPQAQVEVACTQWSPAPVVVQSTSSQQPETAMQPVRHCF